MTLANARIITQVGVNMGVPPPPSPQYPRPCSSSSAIAGALADHDAWDGCMRAAALAYLEDDTAAAERQLWCQRIVVDALAHGTASRPTDG